MSASQLETRFAQQLVMLGLPEPEREYVFHPVRKWRFDAAWPEHRLAVELEGGVYSGGRHTRGSGYEGDLAKYNQAQLLGWAVLRFSRSFIESGEAVRMTAAMLNQRANQRAAA